ncbi:hypothetical protein Q7P37_004606 [Cladosporium fusiforme]
MGYGGHNGQQDVNYDYVVDQAPFAYKFSPPDQADHMDDPSHAPLMNQDQQALMNDFFEHPDAALPNNENVAYNFRGFELSGDNNMNALGMQMPQGMNFGGATGAMHMSVPSVPRSASHMAMPHLSQNDVSTGYEAFYHDYERNNNSFTQHPITHDNQAATALMNMSSHSQENPQPAVASELSGSSWGNLNIGNPTGFNGDQLNSPVVSGGPSSGSTTTPLTPTFAHQYARPGRAASLAQAQYPQHHMQQGTQSSNYPHTRHPSLQVGNSANSNFTNSQAQSWQVQPTTTSQDFNTQRRPPLIQYGSDQSFSQQGYQGNAYTAAEEKSTNLLNVPLATQVARDSHVPFTPAQQAGGMRGGQQQQRHSVPNNLQHLSDAALQFDTLPTTNQTQTHTSNQFQPLRTMDTFAGAQQSRKRRISQVDDKDDQAAQAGSQATPVNSNNLVRRTPIVPKQEPNTEHEQAAWVTPPGSGNKRRKSTAQPHGVNSTASASPSTPAEASLKPSSSTKKRRSDPNAKLRQNLSDTQKRNNHIASEQKRRDAMKTNYDVLNQYVPSLQGGQHGLSRSEILQQSSDWLHALIQGNRAVMLAFGITDENFSDEGSDTDG